MKKIIGIFIVTLLIPTAMCAIAVNEKNYNFCELKSYKPTDVPDDWLEGADQYQTDDTRFGMILSLPYHVAQEFKPTKEDLTAVALYFFNNNAPSNIDITVSIKDSLEGNDLITQTINADDKKIKGDGTWIMFDFNDISIIPEETYYIVCYASDGGTEGNCYCWLFDLGNKYDRGNAFESQDSGETWDDLGEIDLCFITYYQEPPESVSFNYYHSLLLRLIERFPILESLL